MLPIGGSLSQETSECQYSPLMRLEFASAWIGKISGCPSGPGVTSGVGGAPGSVLSRSAAGCWKPTRGSARYFGELHIHPSNVRQPIAVGARLSTRTDSLPRPSSPSGNAIFQGRDKDPETLPS